MKVLLVHQGRENLGIEYLSAVLKEAGHEVSLAYEYNLFGLNDNVFYSPLWESVFSQNKQILQKIDQFQPELVAFSVYTSTYAWACKIARKVKERRDVPVVFGGIHATLVPDEIIKRMTAASAPWAGKKKDELTKEDKRARSKAWRDEGKQICIDLIQQLREIEGVAGVHVMAIEWEEAVKPIVQGAGLYPRPTFDDQAA